MPASVSIKGVVSPRRLTLPFPRFHLSQDLVGSLLDTEAQPEGRAHGTYLDFRGFIVLSAHGDLD
jgi:hypothetical protein